ncbi:MAG: hypothetical protein KAT71_05705 [Gammaproteobacteria bacterium]|nr:hypothetical protein [Gammaproteobacteria bacterium]
MTKIIRILIVALISYFIIFLTGCTSGYVDPSAGSPTVAEVYNSANSSQTTFGSGTTDSDVAQPSVALPKVQQGKFNDNIASVIDSQFPKLPNPEGVMYIFGHYADSGEIPVPGHFITFTMYKTDYYALPNEIQMPYNDGRFVE